MIKDQTILLLHGANSVGNEWENFENEFKKLGNKGKMYGGKMKKTTKKMYGGKMHMNRKKGK